MREVIDVPRSEGSRHVEAQGAAVRPASSTIPPEAVPFIVAGAMAPLGATATALGESSFNETPDFLRNLAADALIQADWCDALRERVQWEWKGDPAARKVSDESSRLILDARNALIQLAAVAVLASSTDKQDHDLRALLTRFGRGSLCPVADAFLDAAGRLESLGRTEA